MPAPTTGRFLRVLRRLETTRQRIEELFLSGHVVRRDIEVLYEGLFLRAVVEFEDFLEARFFEIVSGRMRGGKNQLGARISASSTGAIRQIVLGGDRYIKWLPYEETEERARRFLKGGRPFTLLDGIEKGHITQIVTTRHAVAHSSDHARKQFLKKVVGSTNLLPQDKTPGV